MNKIFLPLILTITLLLTGCQTSPDINKIVQQGDPTYVNVDKVNADSQIFIDREELYVLTDDEGLANKTTMTVKDKNIVFALPQTSKTNDTVYVFVGLKQGSTEATLKQNDGTIKNFKINVN